MTMERPRARGIIMADVLGTPIGAELTRLAGADPDLPALTCGAVTLSRRELEERSNRFAWLLLDLGVGPGDRVAIVLPNGIHFVVSMLATWKAGRTPLPVPSR